MPLAWFDTANWPPSPVLFGNMTMVRDYLMPPLYEELFETYVAGPLAGQGSWLLVPGSGANPVPVVDATGLIDGPNSQAWSLGGLATSPGGVAAILPSPLLPTLTYRIRVRMRADAAAVFAGGQEPYLGFFNGPPDLVGYTTDSFDVSVHYDPALLAQNVRLYDQLNPAGVGQNTALPPGTPFTWEFDLLGAGSYCYRLNGGLWSAPSQMYAGNERIDRLGFMSPGQPCPGVCGFDSLRIVQTQPATPVGSSRMFSGEVAGPIKTTGWNACTINCAGPAFDAAASVLVEHSIDGVNWYTLINIPGNASLSEVATIGAFSTGMIRMTATLPNDGAAQGVVVVGITR